MHININETEWINMNAFENLHSNILEKIHKENECQMKDQSSLTSLNVQKK